MHRILLAIVASLTLILTAAPGAATAESTDHGLVHGQKTDGGFAKYVALGDSYTAGPLSPLLTTGPLGCARSSSNYPAFLASYFHVDTFVDVSCSAARSEHMFESQTGVLPESLPENDNPPQLQALTNDTDLVTLGIGGNDFGLFGEMIDQCAEAAEEHPNADAPCKDRFTKNGIDTKIRDAKKIQDNAEEVLAGIHERAPEATVIVVNYLHILPESGTCSDIPFAEGDYAWGSRVHRRLNESLDQAAARFDAEYVDMYAASEGHDACSDDPWVNGATIKAQAMNFHPYRRGMRAIAQTIYKQVTDNRAPSVIPELALLLRITDVVDIDGLLKYLASVGKTPKETIDRPADDSYPPASAGRR